MATANDIVKKAVSQIGVKENPSGSNCVKYNTDYYGKVVRGTAYPWCCSWVWWIFKECGASHLFCGGQKTAYCPTVESYYKSIGRWYTSNPQVGDLVLFDFYGKNRSVHIGVFEKSNSDGTYNTIEGNTSATSDDNGGCVMRRKRKKSVIRGFARPYYDGAVQTPTPTAETTKKAEKKEENTVNVTLTVLKKGSKGKEVKTLQRLLISLGYSCGLSGVDGDFGNGTLNAIKAFQKAKKLTVDGIVGADSWNAILKNA